MQSHYLPASVHYGTGTVAYWSTSPPTGLLVFVHGFGGSATKTWRKFPALLPEEAASSAFDVVYFGYDSMRKRSRYSALELYRFLDRMALVPVSVANSSLPVGCKRADFRYKKIVIVAHSLGAVVARQALVEACQNEAAWQERTSLVLFAPAHMGAHVVALAQDAFPFFGPLLMFRWQSLIDLKPGSQTLATLLDETAHLARDDNSHCLLARKVILGDCDDIVDPARFFRDPTPTVLQGVGHADVCKPDYNSSAQMTELLALL
jgi:pimeloyl-ACP methyl ester carboxylesterase